MKRPALMHSLGLATGAFATGALAVVAFALYHPVGEPARLAAPITTTNSDGHRVETFVIEAPADILAVTHNGSNLIDPRPPGIPLLHEPALRSGLMLLAKVRNGNGEVVGFAVESENIDPASNPLLGKLRMNTEWTIVLPARGTIFASQIEDAGTLGRKILPAVMLGGEWTGTAEFVSTAGPQPDGRGVIVGGTREFDGMTGSFVEWSRLTRLSKAEGAAGRIELQLAYRAQQASP